MVRSCSTYPRFPTKLLACTAGGALPSVTLPIRGTPLDLEDAAVLLLD
jgi:hypothetical protein